MSHPSESYIKYLLARGSAEGDAGYESVAMTIKSCGLPHLAEDTFNQIEATFNPPEPFMFQNKRHKPTKEFMQEEKIFSMWSPKAEERAALDLLMHHQVREAVQILLMGRLKPSDIAIRVGRKFDVELKQRTVQTFAHYFWNVSRVSYNEWRTFFHSDPMRDHYLAARNGSQQQALFRAGLDPVIESEAALKEAYRNLAMRIEATRGEPDTKNTAQTLATLIKEFLNLHAILHGEGKGVEDTVKGLQKLKMERNAPKAKPILKIAKGGNFSGSGSKE
jgi:hypothetical protein